MKTEQEIIAICKKYKIENYNINADGSVDVDGDVDLSYQDLYSSYKFIDYDELDLPHQHLYDLPFKFGKVSGNFDCHSNQLTSLEGCPSSVGGSFCCYDNKLTSLEFSPSSVGGSFICCLNDLTSLEFSPSSVGFRFDCRCNKLTSLEFSPSSVGDRFDCTDNDINADEVAKYIVENTDTNDFKYNGVEEVDVTIAIRRVKLNLILN